MLLAEKAAPYVVLAMAAVIALMAVTIGGQAIYSAGLRTAIAKAGTRLAEAERNWAGEREGLLRSAYDAQQQAERWRAELQRRANEAADQLDTERRQTDEIRNQLRRSRDATATDRLVARELREQVAIFASAADAGADDRAARASCEARSSALGALLDRGITAAADLRSGGDAVRDLAARCAPDHDDRAAEASALIASWPTAEPTK